MTKKLKHIITDSICPGEDVLRRYLCGQCTKEELFMVENHLASCPMCNDALEGYSQLDESVLGRSAEKVMRHLYKRQTAINTHRRLLIPLALAATVALLITTGITIWYFSGTQQQVISELMPATDSVAPTTVIAALPQKEKGDGEAKKSPLPSAIPPDPTDTKQKRVEIATDVAEPVFEQSTRENKTIQDHEESILPSTAFKISEPIDQSSGTLSGIPLEKSEDKLSVKKTMQTASTVNRSYKREKTTEEVIDTTAMLQTALNNCSNQKYNETIPLLVKMNNQLNSPIHRQQVAEIIKQFGSGANKEACKRLTELKELWKKY